MNTNSAWKTRFGFYLAAIGSACGLGNLWRFPYVTAENGGGAFVLVYLLMAFVVGLPILIGELYLGRARGRSVISAVEDLWQEETKNPFLNLFRRVLFFATRASVFLAVCVLSYYAVISGWVLHVLTEFLFGLVGGREVEVSKAFDVLMDHGSLQLLLASVHLLISILVVAKGVQDGLEKWVGYMMPAFFILLLVMVFRSLSLPSTTTALRFLFYPDFSQVGLSTMGHAIGHVCFTLSIGFGTMVTFGSYMKPDHELPLAGARVTFADTFISVFAALLIFPIALSANNVSSSDPTVLFRALPEFLLSMPSGEFFGILFFLSLYLAALGASIGLLEVFVANWMERHKMSRTAATWIGGGLALILSTFPAFSGSVFQQVQFQGQSVLEIFDSVLINWILPLTALSVPLAVFWLISREQKQKAFSQDKDQHANRLFTDWHILIGVVAPLLILVGLTLQLIDLF